VLDRVLGTIERHRMLERGMRVGVAVSGGADSVCLLHVLRELAGRWELRLTLLHLNHKLRGEESEQDAAFVAEVAARLDLPLISRAADVAAVAGNLEQAARRARLSFFREVLGSGAVDRVALGHTRSDQAETVLYRFLRGAGTAGLAGIRPVTSDGLIRPLLDVDRCEVERYLQQRCISWRVDSTNASMAFDRNRIRHELLPQLAREWNPAIGENLAHLADWGLAEEDFWGHEIDRLAAERLTTREGAVVLRADALTDLPLAAARRLARRAIETAKGDLRGVDFRHIAAVLALAGPDRGSGCFHAPGVEIRRSLDWLCFATARGRRPVQQRGYRLELAVPGIVRIPGFDLEISTELTEKSAPSAPIDCVYNGEMGCLDWRSLSGSLVLRNWRPGDRYQPVGRNGPEKLKTLFQEARIPSWERRLWPILTDGESIVWTSRFGPAASVAAIADSKVILRIRQTSTGDRIRNRDRGE
jgi:tRNA(Ile)-lysidine synthase